MSVDELYDGRSVHGPQDQAHELRVFHRAHRGEFELVLAQVAHRDLALLAGHFADVDLRWDPDLSPRDVGLNP